MLQIKPFEFNPFGEITYLVYDSATRDAIVVDPGMGESEENRLFDEFVSRNGLNLRGIVNTHMHLDHCFGANYVKDKYGVPVNAHVADAFLGSNIDDQARKFGIRLRGKDVMIDAPLADGDTISVGEGTLEVIHTPGHSPGGICLYCKEGNFLLSGDTLFQGSIGRTDLPGGDYNRLINSIRTRLLPLPPDTIVLPGHGAPTTIAQEKAANPFLNR